MSAFQNEEGIPLVDEGHQESPDQASTSVGKKAAFAVVALGVLAATAYVSFLRGVSDGMTIIKAPMEMNKKTSLPFTGIQEPLPNDSNGPSTNEDALHSIKSHNFHKYGYMEGKVLEGEFMSYGHGMAQDASPIPDNPDYEGSKSSKISYLLVYNFYSIFREYPLLSISSLYRCQNYCRLP